MSAATTPLPVHPLPRNRSAVELAVLDLFIADDLDKRQDAWNHLVNICHSACGHRYLRERGMSNWKATDAFLRYWLADQLVPYFDASAEEVAVAVEDGEFRYLAKQAKFALIDKIRSRGKDALSQPGVTSLSEPLGESEDGKPLTLEDLIAVAPGVGYISPQGTLPPVELTELQEKLANKELKAGLGDRLYGDLVTVCSAFPDHLKSKGDPARVLADTVHISLQAAMRRLRRLRARMVALFDTGPVRELYELLSRAGRPTYCKIDRYGAMAT